MLAFHQALAAYRDGWARVRHAPRIVVLLAGATILIAAVGTDGGPGSHPPLLDLFEPLGAALMGGAIAARSTQQRPAASGRVWRRGSCGCSWSSWRRPDGRRDGPLRPPAAARRPAFWGVSGELSFRLIR